MTELVMRWATHDGSGRWHRLTYNPWAEGAHGGYAESRCGLEFRPFGMDGVLSPHIPARWVCQRCVALDKADSAGV